MVLQLCEIFPVPTNHFSYDLQVGSAKAGLTALRIFKVYVVVTFCVEFALYNRLLKERYKEG
jgi:hypothetical protein